MEPAESKREILKAKVVDLVMDFIATEGGITMHDVRKLFGTGSPVDSSVASTLEDILICFAEPLRFLSTDPIS